MKKLVFFGFFKTIFSCSPLLSSEAVNFGSQPPLNFVSARFSCMKKAGAIGGGQPFLFA